MIVLAVLSYVLHLVTLPHGWVVTEPDVQEWYTRPSDAVIGRDGTVAMLLSKASPDRAAGTILVVHPNGRSVLLRSSWIHGPSRYFSHFQPCSGETNPCPAFSKVLLADDGTPFVTAMSYFSGAYSGRDERAFMWNGENWQLVPAEKPFANLPLPYEPVNVAIAAVQDVRDFAYIGDSYDSYPGEDLNIAATDPKLHDLSAAAFNGRHFALGLGNATSMSGMTVAGFDGGLGLVGAGGPPTAAIWRCAHAIGSGSRQCRRANLGPGAAWGIDSYGNAVGEDQSYFDLPRYEVFPYIGRPTLWRNGKAIALANSSGTASGISDRGAIVGTLGENPRCRKCPSEGFIASAGDPNPRARSLDPLVRNLGSRHIVAALGIADDGRILAYVAPTGVESPAQHRQLAILVPQP